MSRRNDSKAFQYSRKARPPRREALLPTPVGADRFVIRATHERGVGVPSSRSFSTATREARSAYGNQPTLSWRPVCRANCARSP
jgi:hypothetical protein